MKKTYIARTLAIFLTASVILGGCGSVKGTASTASDTGAVETTVSQNASASGKAAAGNGSEASAANGIGTGSRGFERDFFRKYRRKHGCRI